MIIKEGEKVHIIERRRFPEDIRRHFIGYVVDSTDHALRVHGYPWVFDSVTGEFVKKSEVRERIVYLGGLYIINILPDDVDLDHVAYVRDEHGLMVTDRVNWALEINEFNPDR